jgi:D-amino-acid dehydrogenase
MNENTLSIRKTIPNPPLGDGGKVIIIGGGIIGLCSAYYLKKAGYDVTVIDRNDITGGCSFGNMGYVSPSHFIPLATPGIISQGLKWMMSSSSPFYIKPRLNLDLMRWGMIFWRKATACRTKRTAPEQSPPVKPSPHE